MSYYTRRLDYFGGEEINYAYNLLIFLDSTFLQMQGGLITPDKDTQRNQPLLSGAPGGATVHSHTSSALRLLCNYVQHIQSSRKLTVIEKLHV